MNILYLQKSRYGQYQLMQFVGEEFVINYIKERIEASNGWAEALASAIEKYPGFLIIPVPEDDV